MQVMSNKSNATQSGPAAAEIRRRRLKKPQDNVSNKENETHVINNNCDVQFSVSCTTRSGRVSRRKIINDVYMYSAGPFIRLPSHKTNLVIRPPYRLHHFPAPTSPRLNLKRLCR